MLPAAVLNVNWWRAQKKSKSEKLGEVFDMFGLTHGNTKINVQLVTVHKILNHYPLYRLSIMRMECDSISSVRRTN